MNIRQAYSASSAVRVPIAMNTSSNSIMGQSYGLATWGSSGPVIRVFSRWDDTPKTTSRNRLGLTQLHTLTTKRLLSPLSAIVQTDGDGYLAQTIDMPLYGFGDTVDEAIRGLQVEIESLYDDLMQDNDYSEEWLMRKKLLSAIVV